MEPILAYVGIKALAVLPTILTFAVSKAIFVGKVILLILAVLFYKNFLSVFIAKLMKGIRIIIEYYLLYNLN